MDAPVEDISEQLLDAISRLQAVSDALPADQAHRECDETTLQVFWKAWPDLSAWAGSLWRMLNEELADAASPPRDPDMDETGGSG